MSILIIIIKVYLAIGCIIALTNLITYYFSSDYREKLNKPSEDVGLNEDFSNSMSVMAIVLCIFFWGFSLAYIIKNDKE